MSIIYKCDSCGVEKLEKMYEVVPGFKHACNLRCVQELHELNPMGLTLYSASPGWVVLEDKTKTARFNEEAEVIT